MQRHLPGRNHLRSNRAQLSARPRIPSTSGLGLTRHLRQAAPFHPDAYIEPKPFFPVGIGIGARNAYRCAGRMASQGSSELHERGKLRILVFGPAHSQVHSRPRPAPVPVR